MLSRGFCPSSEPLSENKSKRENIDKYLDLARELQKELSMKVIVILIVVGALETVPKGQEKRPRELEKELIPSRPHHCSNQLEY